MKERKKWIWYGSALHFICGQDCRWHLATQIGNYLISSVGELWTPRTVREIHARVHDPKWLEENIHLRGDYFDSAYMKKFGYEDIGYNRKFETMVFKIKGFTSCGCPEIDSSELDFDAYNDHKEANKGHLKMCKKWANGKPRPKGKS